MTLGYRPMVRHKLAPACGIDAGERVAKVRRMSPARADLWQRCVG